MVASHREDQFHEYDHSDNGLFEVVYNNHTTARLRRAKIRHTAITIDGRHIPYDELIAADGYEIEPHTIFRDKDLNQFGNELHEAFSYEGFIGLQSNRHVNDVGFLAITEALGDTKLLSENIAERAREDAFKYAHQLTLLTDQLGWDLWVRLEKRESRGERLRAQKTVIMARLVSIMLSEDQSMIIPSIEDYNGSNVVKIPQSLKFGDPWLYVGSKYYDIFDKEE